MFMDLVDTMPVARYEVLCCTILTHLGDLEVKVMFKFLIKDLICLGVVNMWMDLVDSMPVARYWLCYPNPHK